MSTKDELLKGLAIAGALAVQNKRKADREKYIAALRAKVAPLKVSKAELVEAIEAREATAAARKKAA